jgi:dTDP-4-dehydrorhamnose 3,5-epimerase-like enzyme
MLLEHVLTNCSLHSHQVKGDDRGSLIALEANREIPFDTIERVYFVFGTGPGVERGFHAHRALEQWVVCTAGACTMTVDDGRERRSVRLDSPEKGLYMGPGIWREMSDFSPDAVLWSLPPRAMTSRITSAITTTSSRRSAVLRADFARSLPRCPCRL